MKSFNQRGGLAERIPLRRTTGMLTAWAILALLLSVFPAGAQTITTLAGNGTQGFSGDGGAAVNASMDSPRGVAVDVFLNTYIADVNNARIRKVAPNGTISTFAGTGTAGFNGDNMAATSAQLNQPEAVAVDSTGNVIIADSQNRRIRRVSPSGTMTTIAGTGVEGFSGDGGPATSAQIGRPVGLAIDAAGNIYFADGPQHRIRKIAPNGIINTVAGNGQPGYTGDGGAATSAELQFPDGVAVDNAGNLFIADSGNHVVRKVANGVITTVAGNGTEGFSGDGGPATAAMLNFPFDVAIDLNGNLLIADSGNALVRSVTNGVIQTIAGTGSDGFSGDGGPATSAQLSFPSWVIVDPAGNILIGDEHNMRVREVLAPAQGNPNLPASSVVNAANFRPATAQFGAVAPGAIVAIFGSDLAVGTGLAPFTPLPTTLLNTTVTFNGVKAPLFFVSKGQVNAQVPFEVGPGAATVQVVRGGIPTATQQVQISAVSPGVFTMNQVGTGDGAILHSSTFQVVSPSNPATAGEVLAIFTTGMGSVNPTIASGSAAGSSPLSNTSMQSTVTINNVPAVVSFSGLVPGFVGLYQLNVQVPAGLPAGANNAQVMINGVPSNSFTVETK